MATNHFDFWRETAVSCCFWHLENLAVVVLSLSLSLVGKGRRKCSITTFQYDKHNKKTSATIDEKIIESKKYI